jgi:hypothetical protein
MGIAQPPPATMQAQPGVMMRLQAAERRIGELEIELSVVGDFRAALGRMDAATTRINVIASRVERLMRQPPEHRRRADGGTRPKAQQRANKPLTSPH